MLKKHIITFLTVLIISCSAYADETQHTDMIHGPTKEPVKAAVKTSAPPVSLHLKLLSKPVPNQPLHLSLSFKNRKGKLMKGKDLRIAHGKRVHVMVLDPSLNDYQHLHPTLADESSDAIFDFSFTPHRSGRYVIYADITLKNGKRYYLPVWFNVEGEASPIVPPADLAPGEIQAQSQVGDFTFDIQASPAIVQVNKDIIINILVKDHGKLYRKLEPTMQAFAHLVGFSENRETLIHAHPLGDEPRSPNQRGGPSLKFHIMFTKPGWYRLFVQIKADGKDIFVPVDVLVN